MTVKYLTHMRRLCGIGPRCVPYGELTPIGMFDGMTQRWGNVTCPKCIVEFLRLNRLKTEPIETALEEAAKYRGLSK